MVDGETLEIMPKTVRAILNIDNNEIINLCKIGDIPLRRNKKGLTYFTSDDLQTMERLNSVQQKTKYIEEKSVQLKNGFKKIFPQKSEIDAPDLPQIYQLQKTNEDTVKLLKQITGAVKNIESGISDKFSVILEEKLEQKLEEKLGGLDAVIIDLVQSKNENDTLRKQIMEKEKEIYSLKDELGRYKKITGNFYIKSKKSKNDII